MSIRKRFTADFKTKVVLEILREDLECSFCGEAFDPGEGERQVFLRRKNRLRR